MLEGLRQRCDVAVAYPDHGGGARWRGVRRAHGAGGVQRQQGVMEERGEGFDAEQTMDRSEDLDRIVFE